MFKKILFQLHWFLGITAGLVLLLVGVTGAMLSFDKQLMTLINPHVMRVQQVNEQRLPMQELIDRIAQQEPLKRIAAITIDADPGRAAQIGFALPPEAKSKRGFDSQYVNPYTGQLLGKAQGEAFFLTVMKLHRWLALDDVGKQIVGASTVTLIFFCLSGLYLRWPRKVLSWRSWFHLNFKRTGRGFLWDLHSVIGTWCLAFYLLASLTGLYWSYGWYRDMLYQVTGAERPEHMRERKKEQNGPAVAENKSKPSKEIPVPPSNANQIWASFMSVGANFQNVSFRFSEKPGGDITISYLKQTAAHDYATDKLSINAESGAIVKQDNYQDRSAGQQLMNSIFALHNGSYFGLTGMILMMLASLGMPLFAVTGWMLYLDRRAKKRALQQEKNQLSSIPVATATSQPMLIAFASQTGFAEQLAWRTAKLLQQAGLPIAVKSLADMQHHQLANYSQALFVVSTFGDGEAPDSARHFMKAFAQQNTLRDLRFGLLALGDRQYQRFCQFGRQLEDWLQAQGATTLFERVEVDQQDKAALNLWRTHLSVLAPITGEQLIEPDVFHEWTLRSRVCVNPDGVGMPIYRLELTSEEKLPWEAGDLLEVLLPDEKTRRQYTIASLPTDKSAQLLIRQVQLTEHNEARLGKGSGWLTQYLPLGAEFKARIKNNPEFHLPATAKPLILIGNGTGIAGLMSHLKQRIAQGNHCNWLIFGERNLEHDFHYGNELMAWKKQGWIKQLDAVFSRDQVGTSSNEKHYVQHRLQQRAQQLTEWVEQGAAILVCGSLHGMAGEVDAVLRDALGEEQVDQLIAQRRYLRDVY